MIQKAADFKLAWEIENPNMNKCSSMKIRVKVKFIVTYLYPPSTSSPIISFLYPLAIKNYSTSVLHWVLSENALWKFNYIFLFPE